MRKLLEDIGEFRNEGDKMKSPEKIKIKNYNSYFRFLKHFKRVKSLKIISLWYQNLLVKQQKC